MSSLTKNLCEALGTLSSRPPSRGVEIMQGIQTSRKRKVAELNLSIFVLWR